MSESTRCPKCGIQLPADAPAGLCPKCLVLAGFESQPASAQPGPTKLTPPASGFVPPSVEELAPLFPALEVLELLSKGGMGAVYKARQPGLDRMVAIKILPPEISRDPAFAERFQREARALARLNHPHIVAVYDFGETAGLCYIVMEFIDGANLRQTIRTGALMSAEALAIVPQICEALQFAHDEGIVHRDIKPENILIDKRGRVKIADFGLAKLLGTDASDHSLTATHQVMGTLRYMAPEQMQGSREVDHRADIYSLGVVFYELLTGELPMGKFAPPSKKVQVDVRLDEIVLRALEQEPEQRYQHASEVKTDVDAVVQSGEPLKQVRRTGAAERHTFQARIRPRDATERLMRLARMLLPGIALFLITVAVFVLMLFATGRPGQRLDEFQRRPYVNSCIILGIPGIFAVFFSVVLYVFRMSFLIRNLTIDAKGLTINRGAQPSLLLAWHEIASVALVWNETPRRTWDYFGIDSNRGCRRYFRPEDRREFVAAIRRFAPPDTAWADALRAESAKGVELTAHSEPSPDTGRSATTGRPETPDRPPLVLVFATVDLIAAVALIMFYTAGDHVLVSATKSSLWHVWGISEIVLGLIGAAGLLTASIALFFWKPWARKWMLGVCFFELAALVIDLPYLVKVTIPITVEEARKTLIARGFAAVEVDSVASFSLAIGFGGLFVVGLSWLIGHFVYFTRPRVVAAFDSRRERQGRFVEWLFTGTGAVVGVLGVFAPLALLLGIAVLFSWSAQKPTASSANNTSVGRADSKTGEVWFGNKGDEHVWFLGPNSPTVSDRLASHLDLDPAQRTAMDQALGKFVIDFRSLEAQHTQAKTDENGRQITTIAPPPKQVAQLVERFWSELESVLDGRQLTFGRKSLHLNAGMFAVGDYGYRIEIWRVGKINPWFHWRELDPGLAEYHDKIKPSSSPELPEKLRRFWKEPESGGAAKVE